jgi:acetyltransferase-like isoleucine patch superfamily enzyme
MLLKLNGVIVGRGFKSRGLPIVDVSLTGKLVLGENFVMNNGNRYNPIGRQQKCIFFVGKNAELIIGKNVGISSSALVCEKGIRIGDYVKIGGNVVIYDTDFHPLDSVLRRSPDKEEMNTVRKEVVIGNNVFIGAHSTVLKGVHIGENSIIGAGSVVTKSIPNNEIWAGNPAVFIRKIN